ncbi:MAG: ion transporter [Phycisphaerae bacterium]
MPANDEPPSDAAWFRTEPGETPWQRRVFTVIFGADTRGGRVFDFALLVTIVLSVIVVMLDSVESIRAQHHGTLVAAEWVITILFSIEYVLRLACVREAKRYAFSFFGVVDLLAIVPTFLTLLFPAAAPLVVVRMLRLLRVFRVLKLTHLMGESQTMATAVWRSRGKILVFILSVLIVVCIMGAAVYVVEKPHEEQSGFTSLPTAFYWAIVTMTTVGFGDVAPVTSVGRLLTSIIVLLGYALIIVPSGFVTFTALDLDRQRRRKEGAGQEPSGGKQPTVCPHCGKQVS